MGKKGLITVFSVFVVLFYIAIVVYVFFAILHINKLANFEAAMIFEIIGFLILLLFVFGNVLFRPVKMGYSVSLVIMTVVYTIILDVLNIAFIATMPPAYFVLTNLIVLFVYCLVSIPMFIMGSRIK